MFVLMSLVFVTKFKNNFVTLFQHYIFHRLWTFSFTRIGKFVM